MCVDNWVGGAVGQLGTAGVGEGVGVKQSVLVRCEVGAGAGAP